MTTARLSALLLAAALAAAARPAAAQTILRAGDGYRTPQRFLLELRFGPYSPEVDSEFDGATPHRDFYGKDPRLMTQVELDYQLFQSFGTAAVGVSIGYFRENAKSYADTGDTTAEAERSGDTSRFALYPIAALAIYRADQTWRLARIPLVPYVKAGINYTFWNVYDGNDKIATSSPTGRGRGGTWGWQAAIGASIVLNFIDPGAARELDSETGINNTHFFFEFDKFEISGLGQKNKLHLGDTTWLMGLGFEF